MNKQEFLEQLQIKLHKLSPVEIQDIIDEYSDNIDNKVAEGKSEEEAVLDFGDIDELVDSILEAYNIEAPKKKDLASQIGMIITDIINYSIKFFQVLFKDLTIEGTARILVLFGVALIIIAIIRIPFFVIEILFSFISDLLMPHFISTILQTIFNIIIGLIHFFIAIMIIISFIKVGKSQENIDIKQLINRPISEGFQTINSVVNSTKNAVKEDKKASFFNEEDKEYDLKLQAERKKLQKQLNNADADNKPTQHYGIFTRILTFFIKFVTICFLLPFWIIMIGIALLLGLGVALALDGIGVIGLILIGIAFLGLLGVFVGFIQETILSNKPVKFKQLLIQAIISAILLGVGSFVTFNEFTSYEVINNSTNHIKQSETIKINENANYLFYAPNIHYIEDNSLTDTMIIELDSLPIYELSIDSFENEFYISFNSSDNYNQFRYAYTTFYEGLKNQQIYDDIYDYSNTTINVKLPTKYYKQIEDLSTNSISFK